MGIKLSVFSKDQLLQLQRDLEYELARREALSQQSDDIENTSDNRDQTAVMRYQHPLRPSLQWSGKGRAPLWMVELQDSRYTKEDLSIE